MDDPKPTDEAKRAEDVARFRGKSDEAQWREYDALAQLERESTEMRYRTFTAFLSISFLVAGLGAKEGASSGINVSQLWSWPDSMGGVAFLLGFLFFCFSWFFYWWYHRYSHLYRAQLKELEAVLNVKVYTLRERRTRTIHWFGKPRTVKFHFDWTLPILGFWYFVAASMFAGVGVVLAILVLSLAAYGVALLRTGDWPVEPNEQQDSSSR